MEGRVGAGVAQPWRDLRKLARRQPATPQGTGWPFRLAPLMLAATSLIVAAIVPLVTTSLPLDSSADLFAVVGLLALGTVTLAVAALDTGTAFGGMGSSRAVTILALVEPTIIVAVFALAMRAGTINLGGVVERLGADPQMALTPGHLLAFAAFFIVMIAETGRLPVDNPATHLELTMIHEAMVLEYSGPDLALVEWAASMKLFLFMALLANLFFPWGVPTEPSPAALARGGIVLAGKLLALATILAVIETQIAKLRLFRVPELLAGSFALALLSVTSRFLLR